MSKARFLHFMTAFIVATLPSLITLFVIYVVLQTRIDQFIPYEGLSDNLFHWRQIYTFSHVGFNGGYYSALEITARAPFVHFHSHGIVFPVTYGTLGAIFGWYPQSPLIYNLITLPLALGYFITLIRPSRRQLILLGLLTSTSWALLTYVPSSMAEILHYIAAVLMIGMFYRLIHTESDEPHLLKAVLWGIIFVASLLRITWVVMFIPFFFVVRFPYLRRYWLINSLLLSVGSALLAFVIGTVYLAPSYPYNFRSNLLAGTLAQNSPFEMLAYFVSTIVQQVATNLDYVWSFRRPITSQILIISFILSVIICSVLAYRVIKTRTPAKELRFYFLAFVIIVPILLLTLTVRDISVSDSTERVLAAHLVAFVMLVVAFRHREFAVVLLISSFLTFGHFWQNYEQKLTNHFTPTASMISTFQQETEPYLQYDPSAPSAWCNTMLFNYLFSYSPALIGLPPGIGANLFLSAQDLAERPIQSKYLLLTEPDVSQFQTFANIQYLTTTSIGDLYLNLDADCD